MTFCIEAHAPTRPVSIPSRDAAIVVALEALEVDDVAFAVEVLLGALEDGPAERRYPCPECALSFEWPGLLDEHMRVNALGVVGDRSITTEEVAA